MNLSHIQFPGAILIIGVIPHLACGEGDNLGFGVIKMQHLLHSQAEKSDCKNPSKMIPVYSTSVYVKKCCEYYVPLKLPKAFLFSLDCSLLEEILFFPCHFA
jgi:hypothetical protein